eukprot:TRINITY_DN31743_c0_g1_i1.p1 TRINITY_DN31743_c0_g1~~TRINITY_DN31743_c0_g1_i1.p1  ORF type:complete len:373 (+),score=95.82 TRINITY_DN31743_c0_g1_i1:82-1119(+)
MSEVIGASAALGAAVNNKSGLVALVDELSVLLGGLWVSAFGTKADVAALPTAAPEFERDAPVFAAFAVAFFAFNWIVRWRVVDPLWSILLRSNLRCKASDGDGASMSRVTKQKLTKFAQSSMEAMFYGGFAALGLLVVLQQAWIWPSASWWRGYQEGFHPIMRSDLRCYYLMYGARYAQAIISGILEHKRKDFVEMEVHHVVTVVLVILSYAYGWNRVGSIVMLLLDPADVPLHLAKLCKYTSDVQDAKSRSKQRWQARADVLFVVFALVFVGTRVIMYPYVCWSAHIEASRYFPKGPAAWAAVSLLYTLMVLQLYWFWLILKVAIKLISGEGADDNRSDDEHED